MEFAGVVAIENDQEEVLVKLSEDTITTILDKTEKIYSNLDETNIEKKMR